jgi:hypothetical protein
VPVASRLPPLRWVAEEPLVYDETTNELHRPDCSGAASDGLELGRGQALDLVWAPRICRRCYPDVTLTMATGDPAPQTA